MKISQNPQENTRASVSCLMPATLFKKETLTQVFSCEFCEIFKNIFFCVTLPVAASGKKYEINMRLFYLYGDLQTILRFNNNKHTANRQLQSHVDEHFNFRTLREEKMSKILKTMWDEEISIRRKGRINFSLFCSNYELIYEVILAFFGINLRKRWYDYQVFSSIFVKEKLNVIQFFNVAVLCLADILLFSMYNTKLYLAQQSGIPRNSCSKIPGK